MIGLYLLHPRWLLNSRCACKGCVSRSHVRRTDGVNVGQLPCLNTYRGGVFVGKFCRPCQSERRIEAERIVRYAGVKGPK